jgi:hypothetical protein
MSTSVCVQVSVVECCCSSCWFFWFLCFKLLKKVLDKTNKLLWTLETRPKRTPLYIRTLASPRNHLCVSDNIVRVNEHAAETLGLYSRKTLQSCPGKTTLHILTEGLKCQLIVLQILKPVCHAVIRQKKNCWFPVTQPTLIVTTDPTFFFFIKKYIN